MKVKSARHTEIGKVFFCCKKISKLVPFTSEVNKKFSEAR